MQMTKQLAALAVLTASIISGLALAQEKDSTTPEIGSVEWQRDWEKASELAQQTHKPRLVLFQEVPG